MSVALIPSKEKQKHAFAHDIVEFVHGMEGRMFCLYGMVVAEVILFTYRTKRRGG